MTASIKVPFRGGFLDGTLPVPELRKILRPYVTRPADLRAVLSVVAEQMAEWRFWRKYLDSQPEPAQALALAEQLVKASSGLRRQVEQMPDALRSFIGLRQAEVQDANGLSARALIAALTILEGNVEAFCRRMAGVRGAPGPKQRNGRARASALVAVADELERRTGIRTRGQALDVAGEVLRACGMALPHTDRGSSKLVRAQVRRRGRGI